MRRSSWNQVSKSYKKNIQLLSKCLMCIKLAVGTLKLSEIEQEIFDEISIAKPYTFCIPTLRKLTKKERGN